MNRRAAFWDFRMRRITRRGLLKTGVAVTAAAFVSRVDVATAVAETSGFATVNRQKLYYTTLGQGRPVIFMHGGLEFDHQYFRARSRTIESESAVYVEAWIPWENRSF
jgi:hypothetical protein